MVLPSSRKLFLLDKIDQKVLGDKLTVIDEPHMVGTSGARYFDGEGVATKRMPVFENGILKPIISIPIQPTR